MGLFGKKKEIRFETILIEREREVFRQLENKGWSLCTDPFQFDVQKTHDKLRKDAMKMAKELHAELLVEVWDPVYQHMHWKGLRYSAWRRATPEEMLERQKKKMDRPDYSDTMGSLDNIAMKLEQKKLKVDRQELEQYDSVLTAEPSQIEGEVYGDSEEDMGMVTEHIDTVSTQNPYDIQGSTEDAALRSSTLDHEAASQGPVFDGEMKLETGDPDSSDLTGEIDPLALMMEAASVQDTKTATIPSEPEVQQPVPRVLSHLSPPPPMPQLPPVPSGLTPQIAGLPPSPVPPKEGIEELEDKGQ
ncbi:MAG: hypothetical protein JXA22_00205 [Candidatus Thermoplasmatota archaeon]|nr:hypothetical protein [Candidatus Thermoplasmatota archaeon]